MKEISLTQGQVALVDDDDYERLSQWKWCVTKQRNTFYAHRGTSVAGVQKTLKMHRVILDCPRGMDIDHIDGNGLNNQKSNLRIVTRRQNNQNRHDKRTSIYPGVHWYSHANKWRAILGYKGNKICLGTFKSEINAFRAYYDAVLALGQEVLGFAYPNIPEKELETYRPNTRNLPKPVMGININNPDDIVHFQSISEAHRETGLCNGSIADCCCGKRNSYHGYIWQWSNVCVGVHQ